MIRDLLAIVGAGTLTCFALMAIGVLLGSLRVRVHGPSKRYEVDGTRLILAPGAQDCGVKVPVSEWLPGLTLYVGMGGKEGRA